MANFAPTSRLLEEIKSTGKMVDEGLAKKIDSYVKSANLQGIAKKISEFNTHIVLKTLGDFGLKFKHFTEFFDVDHPWCAQHIGIIGRTRLGAELCDALEISDHAIKIGAVNILDLIRATFNESKSLRNTMNTLSLAPIRVLKNRADRDFARENGGTNNIDLSLGKRLPKDGDMVLFDDIKLGIASDWSEQFTSMKGFVRFNVAHKEEIERFKRTQKRLSEMGMIGQSESYGNRANSVAMRMQNQYCGFPRTSPNQVAAVLGKVHGYSCPLPYNRINLPANDEKNIALAKFMVPSIALSKTISALNSKPEKQFERFATLADVIAEYRGANIISMMIDLSLKRILPFSYQPRLYPLHAFKIFFSPRLENLIDTLEEFEDYAKFPLFDRYMLVVPGIKFEDAYFQNETGHFLFKNKDIPIELGSHDEAYFLLDSYLMKMGMVYPAILGQVDSSYYFLDYFSCKE